jgi:hypothetical protein
LQERRDILRDQLERATNRRDEMAQQLSGDGDQVLGQEARAGVQQRLNLLDERILQIERDQMNTERLLSNTPADVLASTAAAARASDNRNMMSEDDAAGIAFGTFTLGVILTVIIGRFRRRMIARRRGKVAPVGALTTTDPNVQRLTEAVNAIAEEVERIGEGQRFVTQLLSSRQDAPVLRGDADRR